MQHVSNLVQHLEQRVRPRPSKPRITSQTMRSSSAPVNHYEILRVIKKIGRQAGFSARMMDLLEYYMMFTRPIDWEQGSKTGPIVYQSLARTALELGISERQVQRLERQLYDLGVLDWRGSGNYKRYGQRCAKTGHILYAFGVDLSPLAEKWPALQRQLAEKKQGDEYWLQTKREISSLRRQCRELLERLAITGNPAHEKLQIAYSTIGLVRVRAGLKKTQIEALLHEHETLRDLLSQHGIPAKKASPKDGQNVAHKESQTQVKNLESKNILGRAGSLRQTSAPQETPSQTPEPRVVRRTCGLEKISLGDALARAPHELRAHMVLHPKTWDDFANGAAKTCRSLCISDIQWGDACGLLGRHGAALCVLLTAAAHKRQRNPVHRPGAYFKSLLTQAKQGQLRLDRGLQGLSLQKPDHCENGFSVVNH